MAEVLRLTVLTGPHKGERVCIRGPNTCLVGRSADCVVCFSGSERDSRISRHHCQFYFDPPCVRVQDLGSRNGTYINGRDLGQTEAARDQMILFQGGSPIAPVVSGDIITIGGNSFQVDVVSCPPEAPAQAHGSPWQADEMALKNCPIRC